MLSYATINEQWVITPKNTLRTRDGLTSNTIRRFLVKTGHLSLIGWRRTMTKRLCILILLCIPAIYFVPNACLAELVRLEVLEIESPTFDGRSFGSVCQY